MKFQPYIIILYGCITTSLVLFVNFLSKGKTRIFKKVYLGVVPQDTELFNNDIRYNILYGCITVSLVLFVFCLKVKQESLRKCIGVVPQDTVLFNNDIRYKVRYGRVKASIHCIIVYSCKLSVYR